MSRTFNDVHGYRYNLDVLMEEHTVEVNCDIDIVSGEPSGYEVLLDGQSKYDINQDVYEALKKIL